MRKLLSLVAAVVALLGLLASDALAQAPAAPPAPKVTINGLVDNVTSWTKNLSIVDLNAGRPGDSEWYARTRVRPDITGEVGTTKFVLGLEIDHTWGQTGAQDTNVCLGTACPASNAQRFGTTHGLDLNTDVQGIIELKWAYTEFDLPWVPGARLRLGAQPFAATYKVGVLATGDFAGAHLTWGVTPGIRLNLTYVQAEEESTGVRDNFLRGEDWAFIGSVEISPFKGLDIRPIYAYFKADGTTSGAARQGRGGVSNTATFFAACAAPPGTCPSNQFQETRHTIGVDARWKMGPFSLEPTIFYQFGERDILVPTTIAATLPTGATVLAPSGFPGAGTRRSQDLDAWFIDVRGGWQAGPLLLEGAVIYTTGNKAKEDVRNAKNDVNFFQPISTDTSYYAGWAEVWALGIDYFNILYASAAGLNPGVAIGYDKYGLFRLGARASYALTPAFTVRAALNANWTAEKVDTNGTIAAATGITPSATTPTATTPATVGGGKDRYLGTELNLGFTYRFAPGVAFDLVGSYMWAGDALGAAAATNANTGVTSTVAKDPKDIQAITARVRYTF
jgi:hypothetical protein